MLCEFLKKGYYEKHIEKIRKEYLSKKNLMIELLEKISKI